MNAQPNPIPPVRMADETTPFVRACWYVAARVEEVGEELLERWLLDQPLVLFRRRADGGVSALDNRCPHRSFPLSRSRRDGDSIVCGYHGITFDGAGGACLRVPSQVHAPAALRVRNYPVVEKGPFVWVWMGEEAEADPATIPLAPYLHGPGFKPVSGYFDVGCSYVRLHENVLDLTHLPFLHGSVFTGTDFLAALDEVRRDGDSVYLRKTSQVGGVPPYIEAMLGFRPERTTRVTRAWFLNPALHYAEVDYHTGEGQPPMRLGFCHAFTPASARRTHYFWAVTREAATDDTAIDAMVDKSSKYVFHQDVVGLEAVEEICRRDRRDFEEKSVKADLPGVLMRRIIAERALA